MRRLFSCLIILASLTPFLYRRAQMPIAEACSGGDHIPTVQEHIENADVVVYGQVVQSDDAQQNIILHVEQYLVGTPDADHLHILRTPPAKIYGWELGIYPLDCLGVPRLLLAGDEVIFFLKRWQDGTYTGGGYINSRADTEVETNGLEVHYQVSEKDSLVFDISMFELVILITELAHSSPRLPDFTIPLPLPAPLAIKTTNNSLYLLPKDKQDPILLGENIIDYVATPSQIIVATQNKRLVYDHFPRPYHGPPSNYIFENYPETSDCGEEACMVISPNYRLKAAIGADGIIYFCLDWHCQDSEQGEESGNFTEGNAVSFSPTNDTFAIWRNTTLTLYDSTIPLANFPLKFGKSSFDLEYTILDQQELLQNKAAWTIDGSKLAFSDKRGLWLWDVRVVAAEPRLIAPINDTGSVIYPRYFSDGGNYLTVTEDDTNYILNLVTSEQLPDGILSPYEDVLIAYDTTQTFSEVAVCVFAINNCTEGIRYGNLGGYPTWIEPYDFRLMTCYDEECNLGAPLGRDKHGLSAIIVN